MSDDEERVTMPFKFVTAGTSTIPSYSEPARDDERDKRRRFDARFPNQNQTKHCWQNYVDYHKCILAKGEDFKPCRQFFLAYRSLCPSSWCERWDDQREKGNFPTRLDV
ncbi:Cytochrome c oxidase subunit 6B [Friedmanniomyces endolithicus]|uniref:Cytochrome c oxidase subunit 12, mitochondrial n=1 Tax=Friedmanniomyces endolithicus TaxID=329885 RepID=A0A4U0UPU2_9PEZI|nr:Cytochrome c oxidase subunit 6B [Friedmanniomyces endolithicus]